ncbi:MAG: MarR family winged helix-turn-helix transcriptional regulator [Cellvibrionaceae bacterium]
MTTSIPNENKVIGQVSRLRDLSHGFLIEAMRAEGIHGLVPSHGEILLALHLNDALNMQEIATLVGRSKPTVTILVDKLLLLKTVKKQRSSIDGRVFEVSLTAKGRKLIGRLGDISALMHQKIDNILSPAEKKQLSTLLGKLNKHW